MRRLISVTITAVVDDDEYKANDLANLMFHTAHDNIGAYNDDIEILESEVTLEVEGE